MNRLFGSKLMRNSLWTFAGYGFRLGIQALAFVLLARYLGPTNYGAFSAMLALALMISPFMDLGTYSIVVRDVARGIPTQYAVGTSLLVTFLATPIGLIAYALFACITLPNVSLGLGLLVAFAVFVGNKLFNVARSAFVAHEATWRTAVVELAGSSVQVGLVFALRPLGGALGTWSALYLVNQVVVGIGALVWAGHIWGGPRWGAAGLISRIKEGLHFSTTGAAVMMTNSLDKILLPRLSTLEAAGVYSAAYRIVAVSLTPLMSVLAALHPRFFRVGLEAGVAGARTIVVRFLPWFIAYGIAVVATAWLGGPFVEVLLGDGYGGVNVAIRLLAASIVLQAPAYLFADALTAGGRQHYRSYAQLSSLTLNGVLNLMLIPRAGWFGAGIANLLSQGAFLGIVVVGCYRMAGRAPLDARETSS
jgi:O-antigen/teichoic acid export membrane protein